MPCDELVTRLGCTLPLFQWWLEIATSSHLAWTSKYSFLKLVFLIPSLHQHDCVMIYDHTNVATSIPYTFLHKKHSDLTLLQLLIRTIFLQLMEGWNSDQDCTSVVTSCKTYQVIIQL